MFLKTDYAVQNLDELSIAQASALITDFKRRKEGIGYRIISEDESNDIPY